MRKILKDQRGFTLIEMLLVMLVITVLLLVMLPNVSKNSTMIDSKGCDAFLAMVQSQVEAYKIDKGEYPKQLGDLNTEEYLKEKFEDDGELKCPGGQSIELVNNKANIRKES